MVSDSFNAIRELMSNKLRDLKSYFSYLLRQADELNLSSNNPIELSRSQIKIEDFKAVSKGMITRLKDINETLESYRRKLEKQLEHRHS